MNIDAMKGVIASQSPKPVVNASSAMSRTASAVGQSSEQAVQQAARQLETHMLGMGNALEFRVDHDTHTTVVTIRDKKSGDVIRQMPSEEALWLAQNLDKITSSLLSTSA
jgi:flagellar protein FlaG